MMKKKILIVEDEGNIAEGLKLNLESEGYETATAADGPTGLDMWRDGSFDLIILDIMLPGKDGLAVCREIRGEGSRIPILFLTARDRDDDRIEGLAAGGDDYLTKPFNLKELMLRVAGMFRRQIWYGSNKIGSEIYQFGNCWLNFSTYKAGGVAGQVELSQKECMIMKFLVENTNKVVDRNMILDAVWGYNVYPSNRTVDNFIVRLRRIFEIDPANPRFIRTVRGVGYLFTPSGEE